MSDTPLIEGCETIACKGTALPNPPEKFCARGWWKGRWGTRKPMSRKGADKEVDYMRTCGWTNLHLIRLPTTYPGGVK